VSLYRVTLAYDGTDFLGFQLQQRGRTVQGVVEEALARLAGGARVAVSQPARRGALLAVPAPPSYSPAVVLSGLRGRQSSRRYRG